MIFPGCDRAETGLRVRVLPAADSGEMPYEKLKASSAVDSR